MTAQRPVIIIGAPRSGTSLMQQLIRETPGFVSVPRESDMIWLPYCHPANNEWLYEGRPESRINDDMIKDIRSAFSNQALSAATWRVFNRLRLMERPRLAAGLRLGYRALFTPWSRTRERIGGSQPESRRLVDKSVHAGLWLNLVDAVFPDALYIHMVRSPVTCIPSMMQGWKEYTRFRTYQVPQSIAPPRPDTSNWWCFPMPAGWRDYHDKELLDICAFQWNSIHEAILRYLDDPTFTDRVLRIHLEDITENPKQVLHHVTNFAQIQFCPSHMSHGALPRVNSSVNATPVSPSLERRITSLTANTYGLLQSQ